MRPVNLIPTDERRRDRSGGAKASQLPYLVVGVLALVLVGVTALTLIGKGISDKENEVASLETREAETSARAQSLAAFLSFEELSSARVETVTALAQSRFDWERVIRELTLVLPNKVWLTSLIGTVSPAVSVSDGESVNLRAEVPGPALELVGCAPGQRDVASLIAALGDIDGVTRVTAGRSEKPLDNAADSGGSGSGDTVNSDCRTRDFITRFEVVAAFDAVVVADTAIPPGTEPATPSDSSGTPASSEDSSSGSAAPTDGSSEAQPASTDSGGGN